MEISSEFGLLGHSDGDCLTHALSDAILGALALPDIGHYFPDNDIQNKNLDSFIILKKAINEAKKHGFTVGNCDLTLIMEEPKFSPYRIKLRKVYLIVSKLQLIASELRLQPTKNWMYWTKEGIAAFAVCLLCSNKH